MVALVKLLLAISTVSAMTITRRYAITVEDDINQNIGPQANTLYKDVAAFPESGMTGAATIDNDAQSLVTVVDSATSNVKSSGSFSEADGTNIRNALQNILPTLQNTLRAFGDQAAAWNDLPDGQTIPLSDLQSLNTSCDAYLDSLIAAVPSDLVGAFTSIKNTLDEEFSSAIASYSS